MKLKTLMILMFILSFLAYSKEIDRSTSFSENGEKIVTIKYKKEHDGLLKRELFGSGLIYTKVIEYYSEDNKENLDIIEKTCVVDEKDFKSRYECRFYRQKKSNKIKKDEVYYDEDYKYSITTRYYSSSPDTEPIKSIFIKKDGIINSEIHDYSGREDGLKRTVLSYADGKIESMDNSYSIPNPKNINKELIVFATDGTVKGCYIDHTDNAEGLLSTFIKATPEGLMRECIHNPKYNPEGYTKVIALTDFDEKPIVIQFLFEENLYEGKAYMVESRYDSNGNVISRTYHDKNGDEIKLD